jgi:hypothetical protein
MCIYRVAPQAYGMRSSLLNGMARVDAWAGYHALAVRWIRAYDRAKVVVQVQFLAGALGLTHTKMPRLVGDNRLEEDRVAVPHRRPGVCYCFPGCVMAFEAGGSVGLYFLYAGDDASSIYRIRKRS